jgi:hypothetical protein
MFGSCAHLNFPDSCSSPARLDSTTTSNNSMVIVVDESTPVSPKFVEDIAHVSPNVKNEAGKGELRTNTQYFVVAETNTASSKIQEDLTCHFMDEDGIFDLDDLPKLSDDHFFSNVESLFKFDFDGGHLGFLGEDQCGKALDCTDSCKIQTSSC